MCKTETGEPAVNQLESRIRQKIVRRREPVCGQRSCEFEERIRHGQNYFCASMLPAALSIGCQGNPEQPVLQITETVHNASSTNPVVIASRVLSSKIITCSCYL
jgi:hypothetical protein